MDIRVKIQLQTGILAWMTVYYVGIMQISRECLTDALSRLESGRDIDVGSKAGKRNGSIYALKKYSSLSSFTHIFFWIRISTVTYYNYY